MKKEQSVLTQLRKQAWFVFLMVFSIGWSSIVFASEKPMHHQMMQQSSVVQYQQAMTAMSDCHEMQMSPLHGQHSKPVQAQGDQNCHQTMLNQAQHLSCNDCVQLHCQSLTVWLDPQISDLVHLEEVQEHPQRNFDYSAQHLTGFWQQILRPPKA